MTLLIMSIQQENLLSEDHMGIQDSQEEKLSLIHTAVKGAMAEVLLAEKIRVKLTEVQHMLHVIWQKTL